MTADRRYPVCLRCHHRAAHCPACGSCHFAYDECWDCGYFGPQARAALEHE